MLETLQHGDVGEIRLSRPPANALNPGLIAALGDAVRAAPQTSRALVVSGVPGMFSGGLDVVELRSLGRPAMKHVWTDFFALMRAIAESPIPICMAITGHSPAGGAVISIFADYRIMAAGNFKIGFNEVQVGLPVPEIIYRAIVYAIGHHNAERLCAGALLVSPEEALRVGLVDEVVEPDEVIALARAWCESRLALPTQAMAHTRGRARQPLVDAFDILDDAHIESFLDVWFSDETKTSMAALVEKLTRSG